MYFIQLISTTYNQMTVHIQAVEGTIAVEMDSILSKEAHIYDEAFAFYEKENVTFSELGFILKKIPPPIQTPSLWLQDAKSDL